VIVASGFREEIAPALVVAFERLRARRCAWVAVAVAVSEDAISTYLYRDRSIWITHVGAHKQEV